MFIFYWFFSMRKVIYFWLTILNSLLFSFVLCCYFSDNLENIIWLWFWIIISSILFLLILWSFWKTWRWTIIYNILIWILTPLIFHYQQTLSSIILIIFFIFPLILPYKKEEYSIKDNKIYYIINCIFVAIYKWIVLYAFLWNFWFIPTILIMSWIIYYIFFSKLFKNNLYWIYLIHSFLFIYCFMFLLKLLIISLSWYTQQPFIPYYIIIFVFLSFWYIWTVNNLITFFLKKYNL